MVKCKCLQAFVDMYVCVYILAAAAFSNLKIVQLSLD